VREQEAERAKLTVTFNADPVDPSGSIGKILVFANPGWYDGASKGTSLSADSFSSMDGNGLAINFGENEGLVFNSATGAQVAAIDSNGNAKLNDVLLNTLHSDSDTGLSISLSDQQKFSIKNADGEDQAVIDAVGNATFNGAVTADSFVSDGVNISESVATLQDKVNELSDQVAQLQASGGTGGAGLTDASGQPVDFSNLNVGALHISLDTFAEGGLTVNGSAEFKGDALFDSLVTFGAPVDFNNDVNFHGNVNFNSNTGGYAQINAGKTRVHVSFATPYSQPPVISLTSGDSSSAQYHYENVTAGGFDIVLDHTMPQDVHLSWLAISISGANTFIQQ